MSTKKTLVCTNIFIRIFERFSAKPTKASQLKSIREEAEGGGTSWRIKTPHTANGTQVMWLIFLRHFSLTFQTVLYKITLLFTLGFFLYKRYIYIFIYVFIFISKPNESAKLQTLW